MNFPKFSKFPFPAKVRFSTRTFVIGAVLTATFFLIFVDLFKTYSSTVSVLVISKNETSATAQKQIIGNMLEFPRTLAFYDRMLELNADVRDVSEGLSADQRKDQWNDMLSIRNSRLKNSIIKISIEASRQSDSELLSLKTARTLFDVSAKYYNVKTDLDLRIIDGPITTSRVPFWPLWLLISVILGYGFSSALGLLLTSKKIEAHRNVEEIDKNNDSLGQDRNTVEINRNAVEIPKKKAWFDFSKFTSFPGRNGQGKEALEKLYQNEQAEIPTSRQDQEDEVLMDEKYLKVFEQDLKIKEMKRLTKQIEPDKYPNFPEMPKPVSNEPKASAPDNLPIADASVLEMFSAPAPQNLPTQEEPEISEPQEPAAPKEPTPEELKKRLNELLRGKI